MILQRNVDYAKQIFTARLGQPYGYGGVWSPTDVAQTTDCSGLVGSILDAVTLGPAMPWQREVTTESWPPTAAPGSPGPYGTICVPGPAQFPPDAAATIAIMHGGGGPDSHMNINTDGVLMEDSADQGVCTRGTGAIEQTNPYWNQWWYLPGPISGVVLGVDYSAGRPNPADILNAGYQFVVRYLFDDGGGLKILTPAEASQLEAGGLELVGVYEAAAQGMLGGAAQGSHDAQDALTHAAAAGMPTGRPIYFACDWDAQPAQYPAIQAYLTACAQVLGGPSHVGIYAGYGPVKAALDGGWCAWAWQTEAWSGWPDNPQIDPRAQLIQNAETQGQTVIDGTQCDINTATTPDFGQWNQGDDMFTDQDRQFLGDLHGATFNPIASLSPFRRPGEGQDLTTKDLPRYIDQFTHPMYVEWAARHGDPVSTQILQTTAALSLTEYPDRVEDVALAKGILAEIAAGGPWDDPPNIKPTPSPDPLGNITVAQLLAWGKDVVTVLGAIATWFTATHADLSGAAGVAVPATLAAATAVAAGHTVHQKRSAQKQLAVMKGTP